MRTRISSYGCTWEVGSVPKLLRFSRALQTSRVHPQLDIRTLSMNQLLICREFHGRLCQRRLRIIKRVLLSALHLSSFFTSAFTFLRTKLKQLSLFQHNSQMPFVQTRGVPAE